MKMRGRDSPVLIVGILFPFTERIACLVEIDGYFEKYITPSIPLKSESEVITVDPQ